AYQRPVLNWHSFFLLHRRITLTKVNKLTSMYCRLSDTIPLTAEQVQIHGVSRPGEKEFGSTPYTTTQSFLD
ncbi:hypothetical protein, partial [Salmonella enterica]|uniref:hypothetical protein n=1 Tax=Salmonella enterica TaxID=28901 RepID=UPI0032992493